MNTVVRFGLGLPLAAFVTISLGAAMAGMISTEFKAEEVFDTPEFLINPLADEFEPRLPKTEIEPLKDVEIPPAPPETGIPSTDKVRPKPVSLPGRKDVFDPADLDIETPEYLVADSNPQPILRFPPGMPSHAARSGHCTVRFNVNAVGVPYDIETTFCTQSMFKRATLRSVAKWKYRPRMANGEAAAMIGVTNRVTFRLSDEKGYIIPE